MDLSADDDVDKDSDEYFTPQTEVRFYATGI